MDGIATARADHSNSYDAPATSPRRKKSPKKADAATEEKTANNGMTVRSLKDFITENKETIMESLNQVMKVSFKGLTNPELYESVCERMSENKRRPLERQARLIAAAHEHLRKNPTLLISGEMGIGKTQVGISLADLLNAKRIGVMCPVHLVSKWANEIQTILGKKEDRIRPYKIVSVGCGEWSSLDYYRNEKVKDGESLIFIFSYSAAKLGYKSRKVAIKKSTIRLVDEEQRDGSLETKKKVCYTLVCPQCGKELVEADANESVVEASRESIPRKCPECKTILRQPEKGEKRLSLAEYAQRRLPSGWFDLLIVDEIHELKGGDTGQGNAFGTLAAKAKKVVGLTGTLLNGYAESVFYVLFRLNPKLMKEKLGFEYEDVERFVDAYGAREKRWATKNVEFGVEGIITKKKGIPSVRSIPRINPLLLVQLLETSLFLRLDEMNIALPRYSEIVDRCEADEEVMDNYHEYIEALLDKIKDRENGGAKKLGELAAASLAILGVPDKERGDEEIFYSPNVARTELEARRSGREFLPLTNKEKRLIELVDQELKAGRKCLIYITFSKLGTTEAVENALAKALPERVVRSLPDNVEPKRREAWLRNNPADALICNPEKVKTGLDLIEYPTIIFFQPTYRTYTLKQAARRSWRIGQEKEVKVYFLVYEDTPEEKALQLIAKKLLVSNAIEGRIGGGLANESGEDESVALALARSMINREKTESFQMEEIVLGLRESDPFEKYYLDLCAKKDKSKTQCGATDILSSALNSAPLSVAVEMLKNENVDDTFALQSDTARTRIAIYRVIRKGKRRVEQRLEVTQDELDELVSQQESRASLQLALDL
jgi:superfamily II DNA or RNA helicase